ncbi:MAG: sulfoxide reductase heme-binding subunit YedZ [Anaerolineales bacterium]|nr:sulfoxide reductase heme-binding subunit YedZ [Anaerolineales bacterium]
MSVQGATVPENRLEKTIRKKWLTILAHVGSALPLIYLIWGWFTGNLGVDPIATINNVTGRTAIFLLTLSLTATPINILFGWAKPITVRRALGLWAFAYAVLHLLNFVGLDYGFDLAFLLQDALLSKPYIVVGAVALVILLALAITSTRGWIKRLKKNWIRLHRLVYLAAALVVLHFLWQAKVPERTDPLIYAIVLTFLLVVRIPPVRRWIVLTRQAWSQGAARRGPKPT